MNDVAALEFTRQHAQPIPADRREELYRLDVDGSHRLTAHAGSGLDRNFVRLIVGDRVEVEISPRDVTRGRIVRKV